MTADPSVEEIVIAVRESGYLMEQEVATALERSAFNVRTNVAFADPDEGKSREMDVNAKRRVAINESEKLGAFTELLVECKNNSNPFVFVTRPKNEVDFRDVPEEFVFPFQYEMSQYLDDGRRRIRREPAFHHLGFGEIHPQYQSSWKAVQFCRIDRKGAGWHANHGGLYDAIFYPMAKAIEVAKNGVPKPNHPDSWRYFWLLFPIVVTSGKLFLIDSTVQEPLPQSVDYVNFRRELKSKNLSGSFTVTFVQQEALQEFLTSVVAPAEALAAKLVNERTEFLKNTTVPWAD